MPEWAFLTKHAVALSLIASNPRITARELSANIGVTERSVRRVIADLYADGYISKKRMGRGLRYDVNPDLPMRHVTHREIAVGSFLESLGWKRRKQKSKDEPLSGAAEASENDSIGELSVYKICLTRPKSPPGVIDRVS